MGGCKVIAPPGFSARRLLGLGFRLVAGEGVVGSPERILTWIENTPSGQAPPSNQLPAKSRPVADRWPEAGLASWPVGTSLNQHSPRPVAPKEQETPQTQTSCLDLTWGISSSRLILLCPKGTHLS